MVPSLMMFTLTLLKLNTSNGYHLFNSILKKWNKKTPDFDMILIAYLKLFQNGNCLYLKKLS